MSDVTPAPSAAKPEPDVFDKFYETVVEKPKAESAPAEEPPSEPAPEEPVASETESESDPEEIKETEAPKPVVKEPKAEKRIKQLLAEKKELERQLKERAPEAEKPKPETKPAESDKAPALEDFLTYDEFSKANDAYLQKRTERLVQEAIAKDRAERDKQAKEAQDKAELEKNKKAWQAKVTDAAKRHPDFKEKVFDEDGTTVSADIPMHAVLDSLIPQSEVGAEMLYHLASHPEEAERIAAIEHPVDALRAAFALEAKIQEGLKPPTKTKPVPPTHVSGSNPSRPKPVYVEEVLYKGTTS